MALLSIACVTTFDSQARMTSCNAGGVDLASA